MLRVPPEAARKHSSLPCLHLTTCGYIPGMLRDAEKDRKRWKGYRSGRQRRDHVDAEGWPNRER